MPVGSNTAKARSMTLCETPFSGHFSRTYRRFPAMRSDEICLDRFDADIPPMR